MTADDFVNLHALLSAAAAVIAFGLGYLGGYAS